MGAKAPLRGSFLGDSVYEWNAASASAAPKNELSAHTATHCHRDGARKEPLHTACSRSFRCSRHAFEELKE